MKFAHYLTGLHGISTPEIDAISHMEMTAKLPLPRPEDSHLMPNGFCLGGHGGGAERCSPDGSRWVVAERSRYGFCVWGYDNDTPEVVHLGVNLTGREVERLADLFLAVKK